MLHKIVLIQSFLAISLFTAVPVAALLEERKNLELSLQRSEAQFRELANTDALTGQANRRAFDERLETEWHRSTAPLYRLGGEEFAIILPNANADEALGLAERIRRTVFAAHIEHSGSPLHCQTISIGVATAVPDPDLPALSLLALSDEALYTAKHTGRNRCEAAA